MNDDKEQVVRFADALSLLVSKEECVPEDRLQVEFAVLITDTFLNCLVIF